MKIPLPSKLPFPKLAARIGRALRKAFPNLKIDYGAMNGQMARIEFINALLEQHPVNAVVETGSYMGVTTSFLAEASGAPVFSAEANPKFHAEALSRLAGDARVSVVLSDSRQALLNWATDASVPKENVLFYLDAHWHDDLPLAEELSIISGAWTDSLILIDDFEVPGDSGYTFDDYGPGMRLCLDYIPDDLRDQWVPLFPSTKSSEETGARRGWVLLAPSRSAASLTAGLPLNGSEWPAA